MFEWHKKEAPVFTGVTRGVGGFGFGKAATGTTSSRPQGNYFGDGSDGSLSTSGNVTYTVQNKNGSYDGDYVVKQYTDLTVNNGHTITTDQPCKGLFIHVSGNLTINSGGIISMSRRGAANNPDSTTGSDGLVYMARTSDGTATRTEADFTGCGSALIGVVSRQGEITGNGHIFQIPKRGADGGSGKNPTSNGQSQNGDNGTAGSATLSSSTYSIKLGGGGGGGKYYDTNSCSNSQVGSSGRGGNATCFSGGTGGGGKMSGTGSTDSAAGDGDDNGGAGGKGGNGHCGGDHTVTGGCGNPGGTDQYKSVSQGGGARTDPGNANAGTGGVVWLIVKGNVTINGTINVSGTSQSTSGRDSGNTYGGGGGSGGGAIIILHGGSYSNSGSLNTLGGSGFDAFTADGGSGGSGTTVVKQILTV